MLIAQLLTVAAIAALIAAALNRNGRLAMSMLISTVAGWFLRTLVVIAPQLALDFVDALLSAFRTNTDAWAKVVTLFTDELTGGANQAAGAGGSGPPSGQGLIGLVNAKPLIEAIVGSLIPAGGITPETGESSMQALLGLNVALALQGWWVSATADLVSLGRFGAAADLPHAFESALGLNRITRLAWKASVKATIQDPLTELYNRRYTFKKLTIGEAHQAWHRGLIDDSGYLDAAAAAGYSHDRAAILLALAAQSYSTAEVTELVRFGVIPDELAIGLLRESGWDSGRAVTLLEMARARETQKVLDGLAATARRLFQQGKMSEQQLLALLAEAHVAERDRGIILAEEQLIRAEGRSLTVAELLQAARHETLSAQEVRARLLRMGYANDDIDVLLGNERRVLSTGQIVDLLVRARITAEEALRRLQAEGYSADDAQLIISLRGRRLSEGQIMDALVERVISVEQARAELTVLGFDPDQIDILLAFLRRQLSPADIQVALTRGLISEGEAQDKLLRLGFSPQDALVIIELRRRIMTVGQILDAFEDGLITRVETLGDLQARGFSPDDALLLVRVFELRVRQKPAPAAPGAPPAAPAPPHPRAPSARRHRTGAPPPAAPAP